MSADHGWNALPGSAPEWSEADLLQWIVDPERRATTPRAELVEHAEPDDPAEGALRLAELEGFVSRCRSACAEIDAETAVDERSLVEAVLAKTTREDLSWRGDLRLLRGFVGQSLRRSVLLRIVAASLLVHAMAMPVIAWYAWRSPEPEGIGIRFLPAPEATETFAPEVLPELEAAPIPEEFQLPDSLLDARYVENSIRWGRYTAQRDLPVLPPGLLPDTVRSGSGHPGGLGLVLLRLRLAVLRGSEFPPVVVWERAGAGARAMQVELLLDQFLIQGHPNEALAPALRQLADAREQPEPARSLALSSLARAESYGLLGGAARDTLEQARRDGAKGALVERTGDLRRVGPFDPAWIELCRRFAEQEGWPAGVVQALATED